MEIRMYQEAIREWCDRNFGKQSDLVLYGGTLEEAGELMRGAVKREQGIRGTREEWDAEIQKEVGDVFIKLASVCAAESWQLDAVIANRWAVVSQRNWTVDKIGHGLPGDSDV